MSFKYRIIPFIGKIKSNETAVQVSDQLEGVINQGAQEGWEFDQLNSVNIEIKPGCLSSLFGRKSDYTRFDMVIFKKLV